jgi:hypothetical protein
MNHTRSVITCFVGWRGDVPMSKNALNFGAGLGAYIDTSRDGSRGERRYQPDVLWQFCFPNAETVRKWRHVGSQRDGLHGRPIVT